MEQENEKQRALAVQKALDDLFSAANGMRIALWTTEAGTSSRKVYVDALDNALDEARALAGISIRRPMNSVFGFTLDEIKLAIDTADLYNPGWRNKESRRPEGLTTLTVQTHHPEDYELINHEDGTQWRGTANGDWKALPVIEFKVDPAAPSNSSIVFTVCPHQVDTRFNHCLRCEESKRYVDPINEYQRGYNDGVIQTACGCGYPKGALIHQPEQVVSGHPFGSIKLDHEFTPGIVPGDEGDTDYRERCHFPWKKGLICGLRESEHAHNGD